jgi:hypothetical protein
MVWDGTISRDDIMVLSNGAVQGIPTGTWTQRSFGVDSTRNARSLYAISSGVRILEDGWYESHAYVSWSPQATNTRSLMRLILAASSGTAVTGTGVLFIGLSEMTGYSGTSLGHSTSGAFFATANQFVRVELWQNSGVTVNVSTARLVVRRI